MGKSRNFEAQRKLFSVQKKLPLYKIMAGVCPDGYIALLWALTMLYTMMPPSSVSVSMTTSTEIYCAHWRGTHFWLTGALGM